MLNKINYPKNPLQVLALFILLCYAVASLFFGMSKITFDGCERKWIIAYITLFPVLTLGVFYRLVVKHHKKLYAPFDFRSDDSFWRIEATSKDIVIKKDKEFQDELMKRSEDEEIQQPNNSSQNITSHTAYSPQLMSSNTPSIQPFYSRKNDRSNFDEVKSWVVKNISKQEGIELIENVTIRKNNQQRFYFDAFCRGEDILYVAEIRVVRSEMTPSMLKSRLSRFLLSVEQLKRVPYEVHPIIAIVTAHWEKTKQEGYKRTLKKLLPANYEIYVFDIDSMNNE